MYKVNAKYRWKLIILLGIMALIIGVVVTAKSHANMDWQDFSDTESQTVTSTMNIAQIEVSLEDILNQYEGLMNSSHQTSKNEMISNLDKLYQLSVNDYNNVNALNDSSNNNQLLDELAQGSTSLTSSIFEMKDSLANTGDLSEAQLKNSKEDLASAVREIGRAIQAIKK